MKKMNLAKVVCLFCAFSLLMITGLSTSAIAAEKSYKWKLGEPFTKGTLQYELTEDWIKRVEEATEVG